MTGFRPALFAASAMGFAACTAPVQEAGDAGQAPLAFVTQYACGDMTAEIGVAEDRMTLRAGGKDYVLAAVQTASGAKYAADGAGPETSFWSKGDNGLLMVEGVTYPECAKSGGYGEAVAAGASAQAKWIARGHEPFWNVSIEAGEIVLVYDLGAKTYRTAAPEPEAIAGGRRYTGTPPVLVMTVLDKVCGDSMTGLPYPETVSVAYGEQTFEGCGGDPHALLTGADWVIERINGSAVAAGARVSLAFDSREGRITGRSGCNAYGAEYSVGGEGIGFGPVMTTEMACANALMMQERRLYDALALVDGYQLEKDGALVLTGPEGTQIVARR
ncbi:MAG: META domain-containing protein [Hyphomonas sp.]